jgi:hypothetical protein
MQGRAEQTIQGDRSGFSGQFMQRSATASFHQYQLVGAHIHAK